MGGKGVSKRKPGQPRSKPMASGIVKRKSPLLRAEEDLSILSNRDMSGLVSDSIKKPKKD